MKLCSMVLKDCGVQAFMPPQFVTHKNAMIRALTDALKNKESKADYVKHPEDFELYCNGEFDDQSGLLLPVSPPTLVVRLKDLVGG